MENLKQTRFSGSPVLSCILPKERNEYGEWIIADEDYYIGAMCNVVGIKIFHRFEPKLQLPFTSELETSFINSDQLEELDLLDYENKIALANPSDELQRGRNYVLVSKSKLLAYDNVIAQYQYIVECHYKSLKFFFDKFNLNHDILNKAISLLREDDFFILAYQTARHKSKNVIAGVQKRYELNQVSHRFILWDADLKVIQTQELPSYQHETIIEKKVPYDKKKEYVMNKLYPPMSFWSDEKWKRDTYYFTWGIPLMCKNIEYYEFSLKTMQLIKKD
jgi:hypothetical protein